MTILASDLISRAEEIVSENPVYRSGGSGTDGTCDCIGLIIGAIRRAGGSWPGMHGSNYAARKEMEYLLPLSGTGELKPGEIVFKAREPGESGYSLPSRYGKGGRYYTGDLRDYYHVGIVESVYPLRIRHMTSPRAKMDTSLGKWSFHGKLKMVSMDGSAADGAKENDAEHFAGDPGKGEGKSMETVIIGGGELSAPVHLRKGPSTATPAIAKIPQGSEAELLEDGENWNRIRWKGHTGYVMASFVKRGGAGSGEMVSVSKAELEKAYDILGDLLGLRG